MVIDSAVVFLDVEESADNYPTGGATRLLLHGSATHLVGSGPAGRTTVEELSEIAGATSVIHADSYASVFNNFFDLIIYESARGLEAPDDPRWKFHIRAPLAGVNHVLPALTTRLRLPITAGWMGGYARVTAVAPLGNNRRLIFATPLYVEHISPPEP